MLLAAAEANSIAKQASTRPLPVDRSKSGQTVTPAKYDTGWQFGVARSVRVKGDPYDVTPTPPPPPPPTPTPTPTPAGSAGKLRYGDVGRIDLIRLIKDTYTADLSNLPDSAFSGFNTDTVEIVSNGIALKGAYGQYLTGKRNDPATSSAASTAITAASAAETPLETGFGVNGVLFLAAQLSPADMATLRNGGRLPDGREIIIKIKGISVNGRPRPEDKPLTLKVLLEDFGDATGRVFFGDRDLTNPGYSKMELSGPVGMGQNNNNRLDVFKVEQRLKYLGFPAMGSGHRSDQRPIDLGSGKDHVYSMPTNTPQDEAFKVDGKWEQADADAAWLFHCVVNYRGINFGTRQAGSTWQLVNHVDRHGSPTSNRPYFDNISAEASRYTVDRNRRNDKTVDYLNAWNAPHWMNIGQISGWQNDQVLPYPSPKVETYGTSWMRDLMVAKQFAPQKFRQVTSAFRGATDANHGYTPFAHASHDLGMAMDIGIKDYISARDMKNTGEQLVQAFADHPLAANYVGAWSNADAQALMDKMISTSKNRQDKALGEFLSLYSLTQEGSTGSRDTLANQFKGSGDKGTMVAGLFGDGTQAGGLISGVIIGGSDRKTNTYPNIHYALQKLGFHKKPPAKASNYPTQENLGPHYHHFHVYLKPPAPKVLDSLVAEEVVPQSVMPQTYASLATNKGARIITPAVVRQVERELRNRCVDLDNVTYSDPKKYVKGYLDPALSVVDQLASRGIKATDPIRARVTLQPTHGRIAVLEEQTEKFGVKGGGSGIVTTNTYLYTPDKSYIGKDTVAFEVDVNGHTFRVSYELRVLKQPSDQECDSYISDEALLIEPESLTLVSDDDATIELQSWLSTAQLNGQLFEPSPVTVQIAPLADAAVGQTIGTTITLDATAAGHGWFIDPTPASNEEFLATANANEWIARPGSDADGRMDMLSVLLHEYGHALGLDHSGSGHDFMAATLPPGVRRLPSADELAQLQLALSQAAAAASPADPQAPAQPSTPALPLGAGLSLIGVGRLRQSRYGGETFQIGNAQALAAPRYAVAANPRLANGELSSAAGWATDGHAVLGEAAERQTRLKQTFTPGAQGR